MQFGHLTKLLQLSFRRLKEICLYQCRSLQAELRISFYSFFFVKTVVSYCFYECNNNVHEFSRVPFGTQILDFVIVFIHHHPQADMRSFTKIYLFLQ